MQCAAIEFARNVLKLKEAHTTEIDPNTPYPVIDLMDNQKEISGLGGSMRLGSYNCELKKESHAYKAYKRKIISERHRHRYEFNNEYRNRFTENGMALTGINPEENLVEIIEYENHPWFVGVQFHPEYKSTVKQPHPLFIGFIKAANNFHKREKNK
jgi:CTP synthase